MLSTALLRRLRVAICRVQHFSNGNCGRGGGIYNQTRQNLKIGKQTRALYQGFTGNQRTAIEYGTNVVGGIPPIMVDKPVFQTVQEGMRAVRPDASSVFVPQLRASDDSDDGGKSDPCKPKKPKSDPCKKKKSDPCKKKKSDPCKKKESSHKGSDPCVKPFPCGSNKKPC